MEQISLAIRADGNLKIGMGHLMRTLSIAIALKQKNIHVFYITSESESKRFVEERGFACHLLSQKFDEMVSEVEETLAFVNDNQIQVMLVDSYNATEAYLSAINAQIPVFYLDDLGRMDLPIAGLINYNIYGNDMGYEETYAKSVTLLLGSSYAPVKPQFLETEYTQRKDAKNILITMGGSDALNITGQLADRLLKDLPTDVCITAICGRFNPNLSDLESLANKDTRLHILSDVPDMWNKMAEADLCIASASSTMYELSTMGVPTICCYYVENQRRIAEGFANIGLCNAGDFSKEADTVLSNIATEVDKLLCDYGKRNALSTKMKKICDGKGASRIADEILDFLQ